MAATASQRHPAPPAAPSAAPVVSDPAGVPVPMFPAPSAPGTGAGSGSLANPPTRRMDFLNIPGHLQVRVSQNPTLIKIYGAVGVLLLVGLLFLVKTGLDAISELQLTLHYGPAPRLAQGDAVLGLAEEAAVGASHWVAINNRGVFSVIILPGGDDSKGFLLPIGYMPDPEGRTPPEVLADDLNGDGTPDLQVIMGASSVVFIHDKDKAGREAWRIPTQDELPRIRAILNQSAGGHK